jgi:membrane protein DedA with SNARE-associated domain
VVRTFIAFPAGVARMSLGKFIVYSFIGSLIWCWALAWVGERLGEHWDSLGLYFHRFDALIVAVILAGAVWWIWRHLRHLKEDAGHT